MKPQPKNTKELIELIDRYESITLEEIEKNWQINGFTTAKILTGFGTPQTCILCKKVGRNYSGSLRCMDCVFEIRKGCENSSFECYNLYKKIENSMYPKALLNAFQDRAVYLKERFKEIIEDYK
ncbi:MAG: hypothetical protein ACOXZV_00585 [Bacteroidales bacterium]|jgi:hypothetical protein